MKPRIRILFVVCLAALAAAGCRMDPRTRAYIDTLSAEQRGLEDQIYALEYDLQILEDELAAEREQNAERAKQPGHEPEKPAPRRRLLPLSRPALKPTIPSPSGSDLPHHDLSEPEIDLGTPHKETLPPPAPKVGPTPPSKQTPASLRAEPKAKPLVKKKRSAESAAPTDRELAASQSFTAAPSAAAAAHAPITQLYLNPFLTGGADFDGQPGDDGVTVVLEPRTADKEFVPQAGPISVVLLDPTQTGEAARVAKWDLDVVEASRFVKNSETAQGLHLQLAWPKGPPPNAKLKMFVRYTTPDGEKLTAEQDVFITLAEQVSSRWTPKGKRTSFNTATPPTDSTASEFAAPARELAEPSVLKSPEFETSELELAAPAQAAPVSETAQRPRPVWRPER